MTFLADRIGYTDTPNSHRGRPLPVRPRAPPMPSTTTFPGLAS